MKGRASEQGTAGIDHERIDIDNESSTEVNCSSFLPLKTPKKEKQGLIMNIWSMVINILAKGNPSVNCVRTLIIRQQHRLCGSRCEPLQINRVRRKAGNRDSEIFREGTHEF